MRIARATPKHTDTSDASACFERGLAHVSAGDTLASAKAQEALGANLVERGDPDSLGALNNLAVLSQRFGRLAEAEAYYARALRLAPTNVALRLNVAALKAHLGQYADALAIATGVVETAPGAIRAYLLASIVESERGAHAAALAWIEAALGVAPNDPSLATRHADCLRALGHHAEALAVCDRMLAAGAPVDPAVRKALHERALALQGLDRTADALEAFAVAEAAEPALAQIVADRGWLLAELGRRDEAVSALDQALALKPDDAAILYRRASLVRGNVASRDLAAMEAIADDRNASYQDRMRLAFALGAAYLEQGEGTRAFARLDAGNRMKRALIDHDPGADTRLVERIVALFSAETLARHAGQGAASERPIFVFGMPRSGTTLVEQILASHPKVHGAGEATHVPELAGAPGFWDRFPTLGAADFATLGRLYLDRVEGGHGASRVADKMPSNYLHAGLIALMLPGARMIHCRRDPLDTCLSCYSLLFADGHPYAYDLFELGHAYRLYDAVMAHWRRVLPPDRFIEIDYEDLVDNTERETRALLDFCALPYDPACLRFHETKRRVTSASLAQVRAPIDRSRMGRASVFRPWLDALGPLPSTSARCRQ
jgi:tetratricopeptide (TPR) repeat protein